MSWIDDVYDEVKKNQEESGESFDKILCDTLDKLYVSNMPDPEIIKEEIEMQRMRVTTISILPCRWKVVETNFDISYGMNPTTVPFRAEICELDEEEVRGYLPSKVWWEKVVGDKSAREHGTFKLLYYVNEQMPQTVRPFGGKIYAMKAYVSDGSLYYDSAIRMFVDQIMTDGGMVYFFIFDELTMKEILNINEQKILIRDKGEK